MSTKKYDWQETVILMEPLNYRSAFDWVCGYGQFTVNKSLKDKYIKLRMKKLHEPCTCVSYGQDDSWGTSAFPSTRPCFLSWSSLACCSPSREMQDFQQGQWWNDSSSSQETTGSPLFLETLSFLPFWATPKLQGLQAFYLSHYQLMDI